MILLNQPIEIAFYGHGKWALNTLEMLKEKNLIKVARVFSRFPNGDKEIENFCKRNNINYLIVENINEYLANKKNSYDLGISVSYDQIFKENSIGFHEKGIINCHAGLLPDFKGRNILNWAIINNQKYFGITVHYLDNNIDTGDIIAQKNLEIKFTEDYKDLLLKAYIECPNLVNKALDLIINNNVKLLPQKNIKEHPIYCSRRKNGDEIINWNESSLQIYNFIRALVYPGPYAQTSLRSKKILIQKATYIEKAPIYKDIPGSILRKDNEGILVKTGDSYIIINEWDCDILLKTGDRFNCGTNHC